MKNTEFASVRGVSAVVVSLRAAGLLTAAKRDFIWYLQGLSLKDGGLQRVARELVEMFPDRLGTPAQLCREQALISRPRESSPFGERYGYTTPPSIEQFITELCTNPKVQFSLPGVDAMADELEIELATENNFDLAPGDFKRAELVYFRDIIGALLEYRARQAKQTRENFHLTAIGKKIAETLDYSLTSRSMVLLDGLEGRGKTEAVKAWCELHCGQARLVSLKGVTNKTAVFREIAFALGITYAYGRTGPEMQSRIEDVLDRSKLMLVIDEAHFLFNQTRQMTARPEMIDWLDTAAGNRGVPVALVTTPQFIACMARAKNQVEWNFNQFRRRVKRWVTLPEKNSESDIAAVARKVFHSASESVIKKVVGYALLSKRDLSAVGDVAAEIRAMIGMEDLGKATVEHVHRAITEYLIPSDQAFRVSLDAAESAQRKTSRRPAPAPLPILADESDQADRTSAPAAAQSEQPPHLAHTRGSLTMPARGAVHPAAIRGSVEAVLTAD
jgi:DNA transposition AAA+ family ATPase